MSVWHLRLFTGGATVRAGFFDGSLTNEFLRVSLRADQSRRHDTVTRSCKLRERRVFYRDDAFRLNNSFGTTSGSGRIEKENDTLQFEDAAQRAVILIFIRNEPLACQDCLSDHLYSLSCPPDLIGKG